MFIILGCHMLQVTLVYHRPLDAAWEEAAKGLRKYFAQVGANSAVKTGTIWVHQPPVEGWCLMHLARSAVTKNLPAMAGAAQRNGGLQWQWYSPPL